MAWDQAPVLTDKDTDIPPALRQGIDEAASAFFRTAEPRNDCWKRFHAPANAPNPIRLDLSLRMKREDDRLVIAGVDVGHANFDIPGVTACLERAYAGFKPVPVDAPGVEAGDAFRTVLHAQQYARPSDGLGDQGSPSGPTVFMSLVGHGKAADCPSVLRTAPMPGSPCQSPTDCGDVCCGCPKKAVWFAASVCDQGRCVSGAVACTDALAFSARQLCATQGPPPQGN